MKHYPKYKIVIGAESESVYATTNDPEQADRLFESCKTYCPEALIHMVKMHGTRVRTYDGRRTERFYKCGTCGGRDINCKVTVRTALHTTTHPVTCLWGGEANWTEVKDHA